MATRLVLRSRGAAGLELSSSPGDAMHGGVRFTLRSDPGTMEAQTSTYKSRRYIAILIFLNLSHSDTVPRFPYPLGRFRERRYTSRSRVRSIPELRARP